MREDKARIWIKMLRSGMYNQLRGHLARDGTMDRCCLGILSDIAVAHDVIDPPLPLYEGYTFVYYHKGEGGDELLSDHVVKWLDMKRTDGSFRVFVSDDDLNYRLIPHYYVENGILELSLARLNDDGFTFDQIADFIEVFWSEL